MAKSKIHRIVKDGVEHASLQFSFRWPITQVGHKDIQMDVPLNGSQPLFRLEHETLEQFGLTDLEMDELYDGVLDTILRQIALK